MSIDWWPAALAAIVAAALVPVAILARNFGQDSDFSGMPRVHDLPTSRLGGAMLVIAYFVVVVVAMQSGAQEIAAARVALCCLPVVLVGFWEDLTRGVHPWHRLIGAMVSAALAGVYAGGTIHRIDLPMVDDWLRDIFFAAPLTWLLVAGACNAVKRIDGAHGLAGGVALMMFGGLAAAAWLFDDALILTQALALMGVIVGFLVWNYPRGQVFLGDAGASFLGFMYAELSIQIVARHDSISAWFVIALAAYPITEALYSIYRRKLAPHTARAAPRLWLHEAVCLTAALVLIEHTAALLAFIGVYVVFYVLSHRATPGYADWIERRRRA